jgi:signal peptidase I
MSFEGFLFILLLVTGAVWALEAFALKKRRAAERTQPWWVEYSISFFPVILVVFLLRSFVVEPFKIPSGSMIPSLLVGDYILVNKFDYGIRLPVLHTEVIHIGEPKRGDVVVFRYPDDPSLDYIKRVIGLPGDRVEYRDKRLIIDGHLVPERRIADYLSKSTMQYYTRYVEDLGSVKHEILIDKDAPAYVPQPRAFPFEKDCHYNANGVTCTVPAGHYFVMGDNRDNSSDSRFWGFVPEANIVGKAFFIWLNLNDLGRFGSFH